MELRKRIKKALLFLAAGTFLTVAGYAIFFAQTGDPVLILNPQVLLANGRIVLDEYINKTEASICHSLGQPLEEWNEYRPLSIHYARISATRPVRTLLFQSRGSHLPLDGILWVWLEWRQDCWVCFGSCWYADGVSF